MRRSSCLVWVLAGLLTACSPSVEVYDLTCEGLAEPLAIDSAQPHFSWKIASKSPTAQTAYQIQVAPAPDAFRKDLCWDSGRVVSDDQVMVPYSGAPLVSRQQLLWRIRVWDATGKASRWSAPQRFGIGPIGEDALKGEYIGAVPGEGRSPLLRKHFDLPKKPASALLYVNSLG